MRMTEQQVREHQKKNNLDCALDKVVKIPKSTEKYKEGKEAELNALVCTDLRRRGYYVLVSRTDKASTIRKGHPDLTVMYQGKVCCIELKVNKGVVSKHQTECIETLNKAGIPTAICWSFDEAVKFAIVNLDQQLLWK
jgi:hypothetical protein